MTRKARPPEREPLRVYRDEKQALEHARTTARSQACDVFVLGSTHPEAARLGPQPVLAGDFRTTGLEPAEAPFVRVTPGGQVQRFERAAGRA